MYTQTVSDMSGGLFRLLAWDGVQDRYLLGRRFVEGGFYPLKVYIEYILSGLINNKSLHVLSEIERYRKYNIRPLLNKAFRKHTGSNWQQFGESVERYVQEQPNDYLLHNPRILDTFTIQINRMCSAEPVAIGCSVKVRVDAHTIKTYLANKQTLGDQLFVKAIKK